MKVDLEVFSVIIKFMELKEVICVMLRLSKRVRGHLMAENYTIFKKFLR